MKFRKIDEKTVCCVLSATDLTDHNITMEDFIQNREKVQGFLEDIIETARTEVGFEADGPMLSIQIMAAYPDGVMITFSDEPTDINKAIKAGLAQMKGELEDDDWVEAQLLESGHRELTQEDAREIFEEMHKIYKQEQTLLATFCFASMDEIFNFVKHVNVRAGIDSTLYLDEKEGIYYLSMEKARIAMERYSSVIATATEYGQFMAFSDIAFARMREHAKVLIEKKAINVLKKIEKA